MEVFSNIVLNLQAPAFATVFSPQGQTLSRSIQATLMDGATPWEIPETALCIIRYAKPDGTKGFYDTLEDDSLAYSYSGNVVTFGLATQALTVPGTVLMQLDFYNSDGEKLTTFTFRLIVAEGVFADSDIASEDFINVLTAKLTEAAQIFANGEAEAQQFFDENTAEAQQIFDQIKQVYGAPWTAATAAAMTDTSRVYVYTGTTTDTLTNGHWYYWNGSAWTDGGNYNSTGFTTDTTLTIAGAAADAKATGDAVEDLNRQLSDVEENQIPELKSALDVVDDLLILPLEYTGAVTLASDTWVVVTTANLKSGRTYAITTSIQTAQQNITYCALKDRDGNTLLTLPQILVGKTSITTEYTPDHDYNGAYVRMRCGSSVAATCAIKATNENTIDILEDDISANEEKIQSVSDYLAYNEIPAYEDVIPANVWTPIVSLDAKTSKSYKIIFAIPSALDSIVYCRIRNMDTETTLVSGTIATGSTSVTLDYTPSANETVVLQAYTGASGGASITVTIDDGESYANIYDALQYAQVPSYYLSGNYLDGRIADIIENSLVETGESFVFITDLHLASNSGASKALVKYVLDKTPVPFVISGGDIPNAYSQTGGNEKAEILAYIKEWLEWVDFWGQDRVYRMRGNHDYVLVKQGDSSKYYNIPNGGVHQIIMPKFVDRVLCPETKRNYYHFDNETQKIRYIVIDGHTYLSSSPTVVTSWIYADQINWLINLLYESDGYNIVVLSHEACDSALSSYAPNLAIVQTLLEAFASRGTVSTTASGASITADFTNCTGNLVCVLSGHSHKDESHVSNGVLAISTTCDAFYNNDPPITRTRGTITESAFDVFSIDTSANAKTIKTIRIGAGNDRGWNYETGEAIN